MSLTLLQKIEIGAVSEALSSVDIDKRGLYGGGIDILLPRKIYLLRKSIQHLYDLDSSDSTLDTTTNYMLALCGNYTQQAQIGGGGSVNPITPIRFPIVIMGANFEADGITYNNANILGYNLMIFIVGYNQDWHFSPTDFVYTSTGIQIIIPGFNANNYTEVIIQNFAT